MRIKKNRESFIEVNDNLILVPSMGGEYRHFKKDWFIKECIEPYGFIYLVTNILNDKIYIGRTTRSISYRLQGHFRSSPYNRNVHFHNAIAKYGEPAFQIECLKNCYSKSELIQSEQEFIVKYKSYDPDIGYNMIIHDKSIPQEKRVTKSLFEKNNPMTNKSLFILWTEKYGYEEATKKLQEFKEKQRVIGKAKAKSGNLKYLRNNKPMPENMKLRFSKERSGKGNPMYGRNIYDLWVEKYGIEEAERRAAIRKEKCKQTRLRNASKK